MYRSLFVTLLLLGVVGIFPAKAHEASLHKGRPIRGEVVAVVGDRIGIKTATGITTVTFRDKTTIERGDKRATREEIKKGDQLTVFGTKLPTGELVAREILLPTSGSEADAPAHHTDQGER